MINVDAFECGPVATMTYLVSNTETGTAFLVDTPPESKNVVLAVCRDKGVKITDILLTHTHWDHTADCAAFVAETGASVTVHADDAYRLDNPMDHTIWPLPFTIESVVPDRLVEHGDTLLVCGVDLKVLHTPGHTEGGICFLDAAHKRIFAGDTLFNGSVGRSDLPGGDMDTLLNGIRTRLFVLDDDLTVFPGHGPPTTIGKERSSNPFVGDQIS